MSLLPPPSLHPRSTLAPPSLRSEASRRGGVSTHQQKRAADVSWSSSAHAEYLTCGRARYIPKVTPLTQGRRSKVEKRLVAGLWASTNASCSASEDGELPKNCLGGASCASIWTVDPDCSHSRHGNRHEPCSSPAKEPKHLTSQAWYSVEASALPRRERLETREIPSTMTSGKIGEPTLAPSQGPLQVTRPPTLGSDHPQMQVAVRVLTAADGKVWDQFVSEQPAANLGHLFGWRGVIEKVYRKQAFYLGAYEGERMIGVLPLVHMTGPMTGNRIVSLPYLDQAGLLATSEQSAAALWSKALELAQSRGVRGIDLRELAPKGVKECDRATLVLPLSTQSEALWKSFSPKVRNQVRKSEKEGLRTELVDASRLGEFYEVFATNMRDLGSPVHSRAFLEAVFLAFAQKAKLYLTGNSSGKIVGGAIAVQFRGIVTVPWASSLREVFSSCPNHSLYWRILAEAADAGENFFDFGRSHVDSGTYKFKVQWGAEPKPLHWTSFNPNGAPEPQKVYKPAEHKALTWVWSRLPVSVATWLGPKVRKQLSN